MQAEWYQRLDESIVYQNVWQNAASIGEPIENSSPNSGTPEELVDAFDAYTRQWSSDLVDFNVTYGGNVCS